MHKPTRTQTGTFLVNGIEYNERPPPERLVRVMKRKWAEELASKGSLRLHTLEYFRKWENKVLGDPNDGISSAWARHGIWISE